MKKNEIFVFFSLGFSIVACRPGSSRSCGSTQSLYSGSNAKGDFEGVAPAGGYITIGSRACTATFSLVSGNADNAELTVKAYTARHCSREDVLDNPRVSISVYINGSNGYVRDVPVTDDFLDRRSKFLFEVQKLGIPAALKFAKEQTTMPIRFAKPHADQDVDAPMATDCEDRSKRLDVPNSQMVCWDALDASVRLLTIKKGQTGQFKILADFLRQSEENFRASANNSRVAEFETRLQGLEGLTRLERYGPFALFLNPWVCQNLVKTDEKYPICAQRQRLISLAEQYLIETEADGKRKNIFAKLNELGIGMNAQFQRSGGSDIRDIFREKVSNALVNNVNDARLKISTLFQASGNKVNRFSNNIFIATNPTVPNPSSQTSTAMFGLIRSEAVFGGSASLPGFGISGSTALSFYLPKDQSKIQFHRTDSGSMITLGGLVPLLVLNTVDYEKVSGGASVLELPDIANAESSSSNNNRVSNSKMNPTQVSRASDPTPRTGVSVTSADSVIRGSTYVASCN